MVLSPALLDTDVLSAIMRKNPMVLPNARAYLVEYGRFTLSIITRYEILRGLKAKCP
jgi:tRNA(fMet)-specific endonuclease VapC